MEYISLGVNTFGLPQGISEIFQRLDELESDNQRLREELATLKVDNCGLRSEVHNLQTQLDELSETTGLERARDRQRITRLEEPQQPEPTKKTSGHIDNLATLMKHHRLKQVSFSQAAKLLGISRVRIQQMKPLIERSEHLIITRDPYHKQRQLIRLRNAR